MNRFFAVVLAVFALILVARPALASDSEPPAGQAQIIFLKPMGGAWGAFNTGIFEVKPEGRELLGVLGGNSRIVINVSPGEHRFMAYTVSFAHFLDANVEAGKRYYVLARFIYGSGFQLRPIRRTGPSDYAATSPDFPGWVSDTRSSDPTAKEISWFERSSVKIDKVQAKAQANWTAKTAAQRLELTLVPADSIE